MHNWWLIEYSLPHYLTPLLFLFLLGSGFYQQSADSVISYFADGNRSLSNTFVFRELKKGQKIRIISPELLVVLWELCLPPRAITFRVSGPVSISCDIFSTTFLSVLTQLCPDLWGFLCLSFLFPDVHCCMFPVPGVEALCSDGKAARPVTSEV